MTMKNSEIGLIPEEWKATRIGELFDIGAGGDLDKSNFSPVRDESHGFPIYANGLSDKGLYGFSSYSSRDAGSITVTARGTLGAANFRNQPFVAIGRLLVLKPKEKDHDGRFFAEYLNAKVKFASESTGVPQLTAPQVSQYWVAEPPSHEQAAIANVLDDIDCYLNQLDQLIAKKRDIKKGAMQELLTGKRRLPGFKEDWIPRKVKHFGEVVTGSTPPTANKELWGGAIPWITPTDINESKDIAISERMISERGLASIRSLPENSLLVTCIASIGKNVILRSPGGCNQQINAIIPSKEYCVEFLYYLFEESKDYLLGNAGITATSIISKKDFCELDFVVPMLDEQRQIAAILADLDDELALLKTNRDKTAALKQGMMQQLLTGKIRLT